MGDNEHREHDRPSCGDPGVRCVKDSGKVAGKDKVKKKEDRAPIHLGFPRSVIAMMLVGALIAASILIILGYAESMSETETYLVVTVLSGLTTIVGGMINSIYGVKNEHHPQGDSK